MRAFREAVTAGEAERARIVADLRRVSHDLGRTLYEGGYLVRRLADFIEAAGECDESHTPGP